MNSHIFVYGSLMTALAHRMGDRLRQEAQLLGPARIAGRLHRVSWYPGLRPADAASDVVQGELYRLTDPAKTLDWLDEYEGLKPSNSSAAAGDEYARVERPVTLSDGTVILANVYLYQRTLSAESLVPDGLWRG